MPVQLEQNKQGEGRAEGVRAEGQWDPVMVFLSMHLNINDFIDFKFLILHYVNSSGENYWNKKTNQFPFPKCPVEVGIQFGRNKTNPILCYTQIILNILNLIVSYNNFVTVNSYCLELKQF